MTADLRCAAPDFTVPASPPMTCGFPATCTAVADSGETVGICSRHEAAAVVSGYALTRLDREESR
jgi:hypothetical protein